MSFFTDNIGKTLKRSRKDIPTGKIVISYVHVKDESRAKYYHDIQDDETFFEVNVPTIHRPRTQIGDNVCTACEG